MLTAARPRVGSQSVFASRFVVRRNRTVSGYARLLSAAGRRSGGSATGHDLDGARCSRRILPRDDAGEAVGGRPEPSADLLRQLDDDPLRAADVAEPIAVFVALHLANELRVAGSQVATTASMSSTANATWRMPGVFAGACRSPPRPGGA